MKKVVSVRLKDETKNFLKDNFEGVQSGIDFAIENLKTDEYVVYLITNLVSKKQYVGMSTNVIKRFLECHAGADTDLGLDIRKYGKDKFSISVLCKVPSKRTALEVESYFISYYNTEKEGYNCKLGQPRKGKEVRKSYSVRLQPKHREALVKEFGSLQKAIDFFLDRERL